MRAIFFAVLAVLGAAVAQAGDKLIYAGTLFAVPGQEPLKEQTVFVRDGKILKVEAGFIRASAGEQVIDLRNHFVMPGLIDCHVHILSELSAKSRLETVESEETYVALRGAAYALRTLRAGFTTVRDLGERSPAIFALKKTINEGLIAGPRLVVAGSTLSPTGGHAQTYGYREEINLLFASTGACDGVDECRKAVRTQVARGADVIKLVATGGVLSNISAGVDQQFTDEELAVIVKTAHGLGKRVAAHAHGAGGMAAALRAGVDSIEHGSYVDDTAISLFRKTGAYLVPTVIAGVTVAEHAKQQGFLTPAQREKALKVGPLMQAALGRAYKGGVKIAFGTDMGVGVHGQNAKEFALMTGAGMPPMEALKAATVNAADLLQLSNVIGTIEPNKMADIVAVAKDPLSDIKALERMSFVMRGGQVYVSP
ncbi:MAG: amidohydrolase family protein [Alphaproteobacteria bacterium]|nr:amidohydrolase family protein [Alphaproteobacteria bacterium]